MKLTTAEVAAATGGEELGDTVTVSGVEHDSRRVSGGELFVPIRDVRDGHDFIDDAASRGAAAVLTEREGSSVPAVRVADTQAALTALAAFGRSRFGGDVVGVTGSVGKTTTKDLIAAALAPALPVHASFSSYNNVLGVPHTILGAPEETRVLVVELGANAPREIADHCEVARPTIGVVTRVVPAHTEGFGDVDGVARAKSELVAALPASGLAVLNADDPRVAKMARLTSARVMTFGRNGDVYARVLSVAADLRPTLEVRSPWGKITFTLGVRGEHQAANAAAAMAVGASLDVGFEAMAEALESARGPALRMDLQLGRSGMLVLDDSYNANPASMEAALRALAAIPGRRHLAVLGVMAELGELEAQEHARIGRLSHELGLEVVSVAAPGYGTPDFPDAESARVALGDLGKGDVVLVKASRRAKLERLAASLRSETGVRATPRM